MADPVVDYRMKPQASAVLRLLAKVPVRGRKVLQKLVYFLQEAEHEPLGLDYRMYFYGPYSATLDARLQMLEALDLVSVERDQNSVAQYSVSPSVSDQLESRPDAEQKISRLLSQLGDLSPNQLELLATVHFLAKRRPQVDQARIQREVNAWKGPKFNRREIEQALTKLQQLGYL